MFAYLAVLQILGIMLAVQTRRVKVKSLKDSAYVTANVYISSIVIVIFIIVTFVLRTYANTYSAILSFGTLLLTTMFLVLMFVPKVSWCPPYCNLYILFSYYLLSIIVFIVYRRCGCYTKIQMAKALKKH